MSSDGLCKNELSWKEDGTPFSNTFNDVYFSRNDGLEESKYVYLRQNSLPSAWGGRKSFCIAELGFGTGLNFAATLGLWNETRVRDGWLSYVSFEKYPLETSEIERSLCQWEELAQVSKILVERYRWRPEGSYLINFDEFNASLLLVVGDARKELPKHRLKADCWYLDGFAPAKNPQLWEASLFKEVARCSASRATAATFSSARIVKDSLESAGFVVEKVPGFSGKREMIRAKLRSGISSALSQKNITKNQIIVIGAGLAGCNLVYHLSKRGFPCTLIERHPREAREASGNAQGILMPLLASKRNLRSDFSAASFSYTLQLIFALEQRGQQKLFENCGALRLATNERLEKLIKSSLFSSLSDSFCKKLSADELSSEIGLGTFAQGMLFPEAGWLSPPQFCSYLLEHSENLVTKFSTEALSLVYDGEQWIVRGLKNEALAKAKHVILANSFDCLAIEQTSWLPITKVRGETASLRAGEWSNGIKSIINYDGYVLPEHGGQHLVGATFERGVEEREPTAESRATLRENLLSWLPAMQEAPELKPGRVGFRASSPDRLPIIGKIPNKDSFANEFKPYDSNRNPAEYGEEAFWPNLYCSVSHGANGISSCPFSAEIIAREIAGELRPVSAELLAAIHPGRFLIREIKKT